MANLTWSLNYLPNTGGVAGSLVGQMPYGVLVFGSYEMYKKELRRRYPSSNQAMIFALASLMGDVTGSFWLCPSEVIKQKMQAGIFSNEKEALFSILKTHGFFGLYEGYLGGLARDVPFRVAQLVRSKKSIRLHRRFAQSSITLTHSLSSTNIRLPMK